MTCDYHGAGDISTAPAASTRLQQQVMPAERNRQDEQGSLSLRAVIPVVMGLAVEHRTLRSERQHRCLLKQPDASPRHCQYRFGRRGSGACPLRGGVPPCLASEMNGSPPAG